MKKGILFLGLFLAISFPVGSWGSFAHQQINRLAIFSLPGEMISFYKMNIDFITDNAVNPDKRRYIKKGEAECHYIDMDTYGDSAIKVLPHRWKDAVAKYTEDTLLSYGIVPWHINKVRYQLTDAFRKKDVKNILRISADLGHYIADANVPLHTTSNYNGQLTNQHGIHAFWESRLPELFINDYDFFTGPATYLDDPQERAWQAVIESNHALDSVLLFEKQLSQTFSEDRKYSYEEKGSVLIKNYSREFSEAYHKKLDGQVERRMRSSIKMIADFWYTCWVDAGQPDLNALIKEDLKKEELVEKMETDEPVKMKVREVDTH